MAEESVQQRRPTTADVGNLSIQNVNVETLSGDKTLSETDDGVQVLDPGGAGRNVDLPADDLGLPLYIISNTADAAETLTVRDPDTNTVVSVAQNETALVMNTGSGYISLLGNASTGQNV